MAKKITKREIRESLDEIPLDTLLLGTKTKTIEKGFTAKQKAFAKKVALGKPKSQAYREAYDTEASPQVVATDAGKLSRKPHMNLLIEAYSEAIEADKYRTPAQLRALVIHQLTKHAIDEEISTRDRLSALKMLGTVAEVGAFVERKESLVVHESGKIKAQLIEQLKTIVGKDLGGEVREASSDLSGGEELLAEISRGKQSETPNPEPHPEGIPPNEGISDEKDIHTIPLNKSPLSESSKNPLPEDVDFKEENIDVVNVSKIADKKEGVPSEKTGMVTWVEKSGEGPPSVIGSPE